MWDQDLDVVMFGTTRYKIIDKFNNQILKFSIWTVVAPRPA